MQQICPQCNKCFDAMTGAVNRAAKIGAPLYCGKTCSGLARRTPQTKDQKRAAKAEYDRNRREALADELRAKKRAAYYNNHAERLAAAKELRKTAEHKKKHLAYLSKPEYRAKKKVYDDKLREAEYADFTESWRLLLELEKEIRSRQSAYERRKARGYYTRSSINRRRELWKVKQSLTQAI